jgi:hypothetical protein
VDLDKDSGLIMKALGQYAAAKFATALRPFKSRLARAKATDRGANTIALQQLAGLLEGAEEGTKYFESLASLARELEPAPEDRLAWAWARDTRRDDARASLPHQAKCVVGQLRPGNPAAGERSPRQELTLAGLHAAVGLHEHQLQPGRQIRPAGRHNSGQLQGQLSFTGSGFHQGQGA